MTAFRFLVLSLAVLVSAGSTLAQGVQLEGGAVVMAGSPSNCTAPATVNYKKLRKVTPEWRTIRSEGVSKGSARYVLLVSKMDKRIKRVCSAVASQEGSDCVVRKGDIRSDNGLKVKDLTREVSEELESGGFSP